MRVTSPDGGPDDVESLWLATAPETDYDPLDGDRRVDVAVVGGGIAGLTAALNLQDAGLEVAVIEADRIAAGTSGNTTAKLTSQHGLKYESLCAKFGTDRAEQYAAANEAAIDEVAARVDDLGVDADFERTPAYVYAESEDDVGDLRDEAAAAQRVGLPATVTESPDAPFEVAGALRFDDQAQFHPPKYLLAVAEAVDDGRGHVFEETRALDLEAGSPCQVETDRGTVTADDVVVASHFPFDDPAGYFARMHPARSYLLGVEIAGSLPDGMYLGSASPSPTFRPAGGEEDLLVVGGQSHTPSVDGPPASERYRRCEAFAREHFEVESVRYRWSSHDYVPVDGVPFVGPLAPGKDDVYVATGFAKWGMSGGTAAGMILSDLIVEGSGPWADSSARCGSSPRRSRRSATRCARSPRARSSWRRTRRSRRAGSATARRRCYRPAATTSRTPARAPSSVGGVGRSPSTATGPANSTPPRRSVRTCGASSSGTTPSGPGIAPATGRGSTATGRSSAGPPWRTCRHGISDAPTATPAPTETDDAATGTETEGDGPGFGAWAALVAPCGAGYVLRRRDRARGEGSSLVRLTERRLHPRGQAP